MSESNSRWLLYPFFIRSIFCFMAAIIFLTSHISKLFPLAFLFFSLHVMGFLLLLLVSFSTHDNWISAPNLETKYGKERSNFHDNKLVTIRLTPPNVTIQNRFIFIVMIRLLISKYWNLKRQVFKNWRCFTWLRFTTKD